MPLDKPTPLRYEMYVTSKCRSRNKFILDRYLKKYLLNESALALGGYERVPLKLLTATNFYGFVNHNDIWLRITDKERYPERGFHICVRTTLPPNIRPKFGEYLEEERLYCASLYLLRSNFTLGGAAFNPEHALLSVSDFPWASDGITTDDGRLIYSDQVRKWSQREYTQLTGDGIITKKVNSKATVCFPVIILSGMDIIENVVRRC